MSKDTAVRRSRERLLRLESQAQARAEARAVMDGVEETVALSEHRGSVFEKPVGAKARAQPFRRQSGLEWLLRKGRLTPDQAAAGERYGAVYRRAKLDRALPSTLEARPQGAFTCGPSLKHLVAHAQGTAQATQLLAGYRRRLLQQPELIAACDLICGEEKTPREAAGGDREGARLEAVLKVALSILTTA